MPVVNPFFQQCPSASLSTFSSLSHSSSSLRVSVKFRVSCCILESPVTVVNGNIDQRVGEIRLGLPSKGRMASDTLDLLKDCQLSVKQVNTRQYVAAIPQRKERVDQKLAAMVARGVEVGVELIFLCVETREILWINPEKFQLKPES